MASTKDNQFINIILEEWASQLIRQRRENVRKTKSVASADLLNSYDFEIRKATLEQTARALISFEDTGRFLDLKRINRRNKQIPVEEIKAWILDVGIEKFKKTTPDDGRKPISNQRFLNDLAWGIVRKKKTKRHRRRKLQKGINESLSILIEEILEGYQDRTIQDIKQSFSEKFR